MAKIDLSGKSGWQSKSADKIDDFKSSTKPEEKILNVDNLNFDWVDKKYYATLMEGNLKIIDENAELTDETEYLKGELIFLNPTLVKDWKVSLLDCDRVVLSLIF